MPKVSVVMPSLNVGQYIEECLKSVINQTLEDIQIICVDSGSTDGTLEILETYAKKDSRIEIINADRKSYGYQVNLGFAAAKGKYIGIVETDDYIPENMYQRLYEVAEENNVEIVKANFCRFFGEGTERIFHKGYIASKLRYYNRIIDPWEMPQMLLEAFYTWAGIYNRSFIEKNNIRHNETPGASYQDNGFYFQTMACARRLYLITDEMYRLRRDNPNSSMNNKAKVFCVCNEFDFIYTFLREKEDRYQKFLAAYWLNRFRGYMSTVNRVAQIYKLDFLKRFSEEFFKALSEGDLDLEYFTKPDLRRLCSIIVDYEGFYYTTLFNEKEWPQPLEGEVKEAYYYHLAQASKYRIKNYRKRLNALEKSKEYKLGSKILFFPNKIRGAVRCLQENGLRYTVLHARGKLKKWINKR